MGYRAYGVLGLGISGLGVGISGLEFRGFKLVPSGIRDFRLRG